MLTALLRGTKLLFSFRLRFKFLVQKFHNDDGGQILVFVAFAMIALVTVFALSFNVGSIVTYKMETQNAADSALYSGGLWLARGMNILAILNIILAICLIVIVAVILIWLILIVLCVFLIGCPVLATYSTYAPRIIQTCWDIYKTVCDIEEAIYDTVPLFEGLCVAETVYKGYQNGERIAIPYPFVPWGDCGDFDNFCLKLPVEKGSLEKLCEWAAEQSGVIIDKLFGSFSWIPGFSQAIEDVKSNIRSAIMAFCTGEAPTFTKSYHGNFCWECWSMINLFQTMMDEWGAEISGTTTWLVVETDICSGDVLDTETRTLGPSSDIGTIFPWGFVCSYVTTDDCEETAWTFEYCDLSVTTSPMDFFEDFNLEDLLGDMLDELPIPYFLKDDEFPFYVNSFAYKQTTGSKFFGFLYREQEFMEKPVYGTLAMAQANLCSREKHSAFWPDWDFRLVPVTLQDDMIQYMIDHLDEDAQDIIDGIVETVTGEEFDVMDFIDHLREGIDKLITH